MRGPGHYASTPSADRRSGFVGPGHPGVLQWWVLDGGTLLVLVAPFRDGLRVGRLELARAAGGALEVAS